MKFRFLGTGTSTGVPQIGCGCRVCVSKDPRDKRRRCGGYVKTDSSAVLVDTPPELREACIEYGISKVDAVLLTHAHMDHVAGFDDIRRFNTINGTKIQCDPASPGANGRTWRIEGKTMDCMAMRETIEQMHAIFPYISGAAGKQGLFRPQIEFKDNSEPFSVGDIDVESFPVEHGFPCCGYLMREHGAPLSRAIAYMSDCHLVPAASLDMIRGCGVAVVDCLRLRPHPTHMNMEEAVRTIGEIAPCRAYITHLCHDLTHEDWLSSLPDGILPAYDGLEVTV